LCSGLWSSLLMLSSHGYKCPASTVLCYPLWCR
jgi:hypothetical protein